MRRTIPDSGFFVKLSDPEDKNLYVIAAHLAVEDAGRDISSVEFFSRLLRGYVQNRKNPGCLGDLTRYARPRL